MKIVIHAGMNKTGSTSIQRTLSALAPRQDGYTYAPSLKAHHNNLFELLFGEPIDARQWHLYFRLVGATLPQVREQTEWYRQRLDAALRANTRPLFLFSAERVKGHFAAAAHRFAEYCRRFTDDIQVIAYVRRPVSFMQEGFVKRLRIPLHVSPDTPLLLWPEYRRRFEALDEAFGTERVKFKLYDLARFKGGDVVLDFAAEAGIPIAPVDVIRANDSIGLEAAACVFAFKSLLPPRRPAPWRRQQQEHFAEALRPLSTGKLRFTPRLVEPIIAQQSADLRWMESRLGEPLLDSSQAAGTLQAAGTAQDAGDLHSTPPPDKSAVPRICCVSPCSKLRRWRNWQAFRPRPALPREAGCFTPSPPSTTSAGTATDHSAPTLILDRSDKTASRHLAQANQLHVLI